MRTRVIHLAIHRRLRVLLTVGVIAAGAAVHAAPASRRSGPPGPPTRRARSCLPTPAGAAPCPRSTMTTTTMGCPTTSRGEPGIGPRRAARGPLRHRSAGPGHRQRRLARRLRSPRALRLRALRDPPARPHQPDGVGHRRRRAFRRPRGQVHQDEPGQVRQRRRRPLRRRRGHDLRTNPNKKDTDGDCVSDGAEVRAGTSPTKRSSLGPSTAGGEEARATRPHRAAAHPSARLDRTTGRDHGPRPVVVPSASTRRGGW